MSFERRFNTKRAMVMGQNGMVATSQPLAVQAGLEILKKGGNAIDAAVATAALMNIVEPMSTGIGGDAFAFVYIAKEKKIYGLNASGRAPYDLTREKVVAEGYERMPSTGMFPVTVPGAFDGFTSLLDRFGTMSIKEVLQPAIYYAENGFAVTEIIQRDWAARVEKLSKHENTAKTYLINGRAPEVGEIFKQPNLAQTFKILADGGRDAFYNGKIAKEIVTFSDANGGYLSMKDLADHKSEWVEPLGADYQGYTLFELPPNGQGIAALEMLNILENYDFTNVEQFSAEYLHMLIEAKKLAYADIKQWVADPSFEDLPTEKIISKEYAKEQFKRIDPASAMQEIESGIKVDGDTVYLTVMDKDGNAVSFIYSLYEKFGSGMVAGNTGIMLQNRGALFSLEKGHVNVLEPGKRPFHTIIPAMLFKDGEFYSSYGVMGGAMQPQGHVQVMLNMVEYGMNIQEAIEAPRFRHYSGPSVMLEPEFAPAVVAQLVKMGHKIRKHVPGSYGGGQGIIYNQKNGVMMGGSDFRKDGMVVSW